MKILYESGTEGCCQETAAVKEMKFENGLLTAEVFSELVPMPEWVKESYYPYDHLPDVLLSNESGTVQMTFQILEKELSVSETGTAAERVKELVGRIYPDSKISPVRLFRDGGFPVGWFVAEIEEGTERYCHVKGIFSFQKRLCLVTVTYPERERSKHEMLVKHFFATLH